LRNILKYDRFYSPDHRISILRVDVYLFYWLQTSCIFIWDSIVSVCFFICSNTRSSLQASTDLL